MSIDIFAENHYSNVRKAHPYGETLPSWCYTSSDFYEKEVATVFEKEWLFVGRQDQLPNIGDYKVIERFSRSIIIVRDSNNIIRAFANTCRHRASILLDQGSKGSCKAIKCPYHAWSYSLDGKLRGTPGMGDTPNFDKKDFPLHSYRTEIWGGFIFINLQKTGPGLLESLGDLPRHLDSYPLDDMVTVKMDEYDLDCNWKLSMEIALDTIHAVVVHADSIGRQLTDTREVSDNWLIQYYKNPDTIALEAGNLDAGFPHIPGLKGRLAEGTTFVMLYPSVYFIFVQDCCWWLHKVPSSATTSTLEVGFCFTKETTARDDFSTVLKEYVKRWDKVIVEDNDVVEKQQKGLNQIASTPGRYSANHEEGLHIFDNWILDSVLGVTGKQTVEASNER
ncbi:MAG: aromatic ring-hydroxylating dioxygenase subunit alpha [Pseudomonadota bacterium]